MFKKIAQGIIAVTLLCVAVMVGASPALATVTYDHAGGRQITTAGGATVLIDIASPAVVTNEHSLMELNVQSADTHQAVEVGWRVAPSVYGDSAPHLFVFHWVNSVGTCYDGCGWIPVAGAPIAVGASLTTSVGTTKQFLVEHLTTTQCGCPTAGWWVAYGTSGSAAWIGAFPDSIWTSPTYTAAGVLQVYGEVAANTASSCTDMGNGSLATDPPAVGARLNSFTLLDVATTPSLTLFATHPSQYSSVRSPTTSMKSIRIGGPGFC